MNNRDVFRQFMIRQGLLDLYIRKSQIDFYKALRKTDSVLLEVAVNAVDALEGNTIQTRTGARIIKEVKQRLIESRRNQLDPLIREFLSELRDLVTDRLEGNKTIASKVLPDEDVKTPEQEEADNLNFYPMAGRTMDEWWALFFAGDADRIISNTTQGIISGQDSGEIYQDLRGSKELNYTDGAVRPSFNSIGSLVPTLIVGAIGYADSIFAEANKALGIKERYTAIRDNRTSVLCASLDGGVYEVGQGPHPPMHRNCRSVRVPVFAGEGETVEKGTTYADWLKEQPAGVQNQVLGKTKAVLFRNGKLSIREMVRKDGTPKSLSELFEQNRKAFEDSGITFNS